MEIFISPARRRMVENNPLYFPFGGKQSRNILRDFKGSMSKQIQVLFLNCQDLKNVLCTVASKINISDFWHIHLNHSCPVSLARNILLLKVISSDCFNVENVKDLSYLWDLWYNFQWPKSTLDRFTADIKELLEMFERNNLCSEFCFSMEGYQLDELLSIWKGWLLALTSSLTQSSKSEKILKERTQFLTGTGEEHIMSNFIMMKFPGFKRRVYTGDLDELVSLRETAMDIEEYPASLKRKLVQETKHYFESGNCSLGKIVERSALNPTLLEPDTLCWRIDGSSCPFDSYLPLSLNELETTNSVECVATRYCQTALKELVKNYKQFKNNVQIHFRWTEDLKICHTGTNLKFDVIDCSTLADDVGLANVILSGRELLNTHSPDALLITVTSDWSKTSLTVAKYVEESLCAPISMVPTIYGLRLADAIELGSAILQERENPPTTINWHPVPQFENVSLVVSPSLERCMKNLEKMCYFIENEEDKMPLDKYCLDKYLTPLTLDFVASRLAEKAGKQEGDRRMKFFQSKLPRQFSLAQKTLNDWAERRPVSLVTSAQIFSPDLTRLFNENKTFKSPNLRILLVPSLQYVNKMRQIHRTVQSSQLSEKQKEDELQNYFPLNWAKKMSDVHYIDNLFLNYMKNPDGSFNSVYAAFLLPRDHGLNNTHCGVLIDLVTGLSLMFLGFVKDFRQVVFENPNFTTKRFSPPPSDVILKEPCMKAVNCQESEDDYTVQISIQTKEDPKDLSLSTDQQLPCEAGHRVTLCLTQPEGMKPFTMCFPHAFLAGCIEATLRRSDRSIRLVLKKALREPWPCHFNEKQKLNVDQLSVWKEPNPDDPVSRIMIHISGTMDVKSIRSSLESSVDLSKLSNLPPLKTVRIATSSIFVNSESGKEFFNVATIHDQQNPLFSIRVHLPVKVTPLGSPMIVITVLDHHYAKKLIANGNLQAMQFHEDYQRIFNGRRNRQPFPVWTTSEDATLLLRYVLRLNAAKMKPSLWQEENVPLGKFSPFLASFISPLHLDNQCQENGEEVKAEMIKINLFKKEYNIPLCDPSVCARCIRRSAKLKRCSRCKAVNYCTVDCQKADWSTHKACCVVPNTENETMDKIEELVDLMMNSVQN